jgi:hypothetical protein
MLFWIIWLLCMLAFLGVTFGGFERYTIPASGAIVLILTGLCGWSLFGPPVQRSGSKPQP